MPCPVKDCDDIPEHPFGFVVERTDGTRFNSEGKLCQVHAQQVLTFLNAGREAPTNTVARQATEVFTEAMADPGTDAVVISIDKKRLTT